MKTTLKNFKIPLPDGNEEKFYVSDFATKDEAAADKQELKATINANKQESNQSLTETNEDLSGSKEAIAYAIDGLKNTVGADNELKVSFTDTNYLNDCTTIKQALIALDAAIAALSN